MQRLTTEHQQVVKRIIRYVAGTLDHGLHYPRCLGVAHFVGYSDSVHAGDIDTTKSTSGILFFLGKVLVSWQSIQAAGGGHVQLRGRVHSGLHRFHSGTLARSTTW
jgi:hypothetical protein